jgi:hypothetical protein
MRSVYVYGNLMMSSSTSEDYLWTSVWVVIRIDKSGVMIVTR